MRKTKKAFSLIEILISISLFSIIVVFVYKSLDDTKKTNKFIEDKLSKIEEDSFYKKIIMEDIIEASSIEIKYDKDKNTILYLSTTNTYHNPFFNNVKYFISNDKLIRIESSKALQKISTSEIKYIQQYFIDTILVDIEKFRLSKVFNDDSVYSILIQQKDKEFKVFSAKMISK